MCGSYQGRTLTCGPKLVQFKRLQKFESLNIYLLFWLNWTLKNKHETDVNEIIILVALVYNDDCVEPRWTVFAQQIDLNIEAPLLLLLVIYNS
jgi:hypothetical protein